MKAQQARGADFDTGNLMQKAKSLIPILVPLFISAFRRAEELAMAMEARCYHGDEHRTRMNVMTMKSSDYRAAVMAAVYTVVIIGLRFCGKGSAVYDLRKKHSSRNVLGGVFSKNTKEKGESMIGLGTLINVGAIIIGGLLGLFLGRSVKVRYQDILMIAVGICVLMLGIGGTMEQMLSITDGGLASGGSMMLIITMAVGALAGERMNIEKKDGAVRCLAEKENRQQRG